MPRLARRSAGNQTGALAERLSDDLLAYEEASFEAMRDALADGLGRGEKAWRGAVRRSKGDVPAIASDAAFSLALTAAHREAVRSTADTVASLASISVSLSLESIEKELLLCERTLAGKYKGTTALAVAEVRPVASQISGQVGGLFGQAVDAAVLSFTGEVRRQCHFAVNAGDTADQLEARLFSESPVRRPGIGGRGLWWRSGTILNAAARAVSISAMNGARVAAMQAFNREGASRA